MGAEKPAWTTLKTVKAGIAAATSRTVQQFNDAFMTRQWVGDRVVFSETAMDLQPGDRIVNGTQVYDVHYYWEYRVPGIRSVVYLAECILRT